MIPKIFGCFCEQFFRFLEHTSIKFFMGNLRHPSLLGPTADLGLLSGSATGTKVPETRKSPSFWHFLTHDLAVGRGDPRSGRGGDCLPAQTLRDPSPPGFVGFRLTAHQISMICTAFPHLKFMVFRHQGLLNSKDPRWWGGGQPPGGGGFAHSLFAGFLRPSPHSSNSRKGSPYECAPRTN